MIRFDATAEYVFRSSGVVPASSDYTLVMFFRPLFTPTTTNYATIFYTGDDPTGPYLTYVGVFTDDTDSDKLKLYVSDGVTTLISDGAAFDLDKFRTIVYRRTGNSHEFWVNGILIDTLTLDISAGTYTDFYLGCDSFNNSSSLDFFNVREWDAALTDDEIQAELKSTTPVRTDDLWSDYPLLNDADDDSGNGRDLTEVLTPSYFGQPPTNLVAYTAIEVTIPSTGTYNANRSDTFETFDIYFTYLEPDGPDSIGLWAFGGTVDAGYQPKIYIVDLDNSIAFSSQNPPTNRPVLTVNEDPGARVYFRVEKNTNTSPALAELSIVQHNPQTPQAGDYFITGDLVNLPSAVLIPGQDYGVRRIIRGDLPASDNGDILLTGRILLEDRVNQDLKLFSPELELLQTIALSDANEYSIRASRPNNLFYTIPQKTSPATLRIVNNDGTVTSTKTVSGFAQNAWAIAPNNEQTILYFAQDNINAVVQKFDLATETFLGTFVPTPAGYFINEIMVLEDDTILVGYYRGADDTFKVRRFDADGNQLNEYNFTYTESFPPRIGYSEDSPDTFLVFNQQIDSTSKLATITEVNVSDGTYVQETSYRIYQNFGFIGPQSETPDARFGPSSSCAMIQLMESSGPPTTTGIFKLTPGASDDEYNGQQRVRIPTPFFKTYFHGE